MGFLMSKVWQILKCLDGTVPHYRELPWGHSIFKNNFEAIRVAALNCTFLSILIHCAEPQKSLFGQTYNPICVSVAFYNRCHSSYCSVVVHDVVIFVRSLFYVPPHLAPHSCPGRGAGPLPLLPIPTLI